jgi:ubiquinone/menaquinone biosynthesis C-methylase UbiE
MQTDKWRHHLVEEYARLADTYDTKWSLYIEASTRETIARLPLRPPDRLLDIGCGTGILLDRLAAIHPAAQLVGMDPVPEMLAAARHRLSPAIELYHGWAEQLPFADAQFDLVVSCNMFHYIGRPLDALQEIRRVLRPGGRLVITDWCGDYTACRLVDLYQRTLNGTQMTVYRSRDLTGLAAANGYAVELIDRYKINWLWGLMTAQLHTDPG